MSIILACSISHQLSMYVQGTIHFQMYYAHLRGPGSSVGIATGYGMDDPGIESRWGRGFPHLSRPALGQPNLLYSGY
jgi:hypothetical protein